MDDHRMQVWHTWHIAALGRAKKMPPLKKMQPKEKPKRMTADQMRNIAKRWHAAINAKKG